MSRLAVRGRPLLVLGVATVLPGVGHVLNGTPKRGLMFLFYMILLGAITYRLSTPDHSLVGRYAGGVFVYAMSIMDAYRTAAARAFTASQERRARV